MFILKSYYSLVTQYRRPASIFSTVNDTIAGNDSKVFISVGKCDKACMIITGQPQITLTPIWLYTRKILKNCVKRKGSRT